MVISIAAVQFTCAADDFLVRATDEDEVIDLARAHAQHHDDDHHNNEMTEEAIRDRLQQESNTGEEGGYGTHTTM